MTTVVLFTKEYKGDWKYTVTMTSLRVTYGSPLPDPGNNQGIDLTSNDRMIRSVKLFGIYFRQEMWILLYYTVVYLWLLIRQNYRKGYGHIRLLKHSTVAEKAVSEWFSQLQPYNLPARLFTHMVICTKWWVPGVSCWLVWMSGKNDMYTFHHAFLYASFLSLSKHSNLSTEHSRHYSTDRV